LQKNWKPKSMGSEKGKRRDAINFRRDIGKNALFWKPGEFPGKEEKEKSQIKKSYLFGGKIDAKS